MTSPSFRQLRRTIYILKRQVGQPMTICRSTGNTLDIETGIQSNSLVTYDIRRVILLPMSSLRSFAYDLSFIAANKNFTYGGMFDINSRIAIFSRRDVPSTFIFDQNMYVKIKDKRYEVKSPTFYEDDEIIALFLTALENQIPLDVVNEDVSSGLNLGEGAVDT